MPDDDLTEDVAEIGRHGEVASFVPLGGGETRPLAVDAASSNPAADRNHRVAMAVIGSAVPVFGDGTPELGHGQHDGVVHEIAEVDNECRDAATEVVQSGGELTL